MLLLTTLSRWFNDQKHSDIRLLVDDAEFFAHKMILEEKAEWFKVAFNGRWKVCQISKAGTCPSY